MSTDAELVDSARHGDTEAFAVLYDRYADRIHRFCFARLRNESDAADALHETFLGAHRRIEQLSEPARFRPWLFSIARNTVVDLARTRGRHEQRRDWGPVGGRRRPTGPHDLAAGPPTAGRGLDADEPAALLWDAAQALLPRDQELLDLHFREGLEGGELAAAMEVETAHVHVMVTRLERRLSTAVGSLLVARHGRAACVDLDGLLSGWDGTFSLAVRSGVTRHIESCETCRETRRLASTWESIAAAMPAPPAPGATRIAVLTAVNTRTLTPAEAPPNDPHADPDIVPTEPPGAHRRLLDDDDDDANASGTSSSGRSPLDALGLVLLAVALTATVIAWPALRPGDDPDLVTTEVAGITATARPALGAGAGDEPRSGPGSTTPPDSTTTTTAPPLGPVFFGSPDPITFTDPVATVDYTFANIGDAPMTWAAETTASFTVDLPKGTLPPGAQMTLSIIHDIALPPGDHTGTLDLITDGGDFSIELLATAAPVVGAILEPTAIWANSGVCTGGQAVLPVTATIAAFATDDGEVVGVQARWDGDTQLTPLGKDPISGLWTATIGPYAAGPDLDLVLVEATDDAGNTTGTLVAVTIAPCEG